MINVKKINSLNGDAFNSTLREEVMKELMENCKNRLMTMAKISKGEVSYSWLIAFTGGRVSRSSNATLLKVAKYLGVESTPDGRLYETGKHYNPPVPSWDKPEGEK